MTTKFQFSTAVLTNTAQVVHAGRIHVGYGHFVGGAAAEIVILRGTDLTHAASVQISAAAADQSFNHAGAGFSLAIKPGDSIIVTGFVTGANNGTFTVVSATASKIVVSGGALENEAAGPSVTVTGRPPEYLRVPLAIAQNLPLRFDHVFARGLTILTASAAGDVSATFFYNVRP